ncbi:hypothetical protein [Spirosoma endbachense]|uniref:Lipocalin-like domain-containing protein n=1 Tax=Spirosoma endbachense TaxID=2666025 RepID=A0A6P1VV44_9BACT|nr:hypothetical protein [Spirosoma endbachense]QHV95509.1 hypothetical protein GJR95_11070 [Spirosoma endbachense]
MKKFFLSFSVCLLVVGFLADCKDPYQDFSPGAGDPRITGTWQLYERQFPKDSLLYTRNYTYGVIIVDKREVKVVRDSTLTSRDTLFFARRRYGAVPAQTLTFAPDGKLTASGDEMSYYNPIKLYDVDSTEQDGLGVKLYVNTNRANQYFRQGVLFKQDTLLLRPKCDGDCYLKFFRVR